MLKSINPKNIKVYDILAKTPSDTRIKIREQRTKGVDSFFNCREVSLKIAEKLSVLSVNKIYVKHKKLVIEVSNPKIQT